MLWRYVKAQLLVLLCGGMVGPIFLIAYYAIGEYEMTQWMYYSGIAITVVDVLVALALTYFGARSASDAALLERDGVLALAQINGISETGTRINDQPLVKLQLHIAGPGLTPMDTEERVIASVSRLGNITARKLVVQVDPVSGKHLIDWERSAVVNGLVPAQFNVAEDGQTYDLSGQSGPLMEILQLLKSHGVGLNQMVDVRSNPKLRQQISAVVRRAVTQQSAAAEPAAVPAAERPSVGERLQALAALHAAGTVTDEEYAQKRAQIIADL
ncbi:SHOCT domain-containing protein [Mycobacterium sp. SMC-11]|uniref:SHOCT domain-containing protein n=1 Tax=Mycobacterium sp. SMC-11 TaxID=3385969 RepID=UPI00390C9F35